MKKGLISVLTLGLIFVLFYQFQKSQSEIKAQRIEKQIKEQVDQSIEKHQENIDEFKEKKKKNEGAKSSTTPQDKKSTLSFLEKYKKYDRKALLSAEEVAAKKEMLKNESNLRKSYLYLVRFKTGESKQARIERSMDVVDFLHAAMAWAENPIRESVIEKTQYFLLNDTLDHLKDQEQLRTAAMDKAELYILLKKANPIRAQRIREQAKGTRLAAVIQYAENHL